MMMNVSKQRAGGGLLDTEDKQSLIDDLETGDLQHLIDSNEIVCFILCSIGVSKEKCNKIILFTLN